MNIFPLLLLSCDSLFASLFLCWSPLVRRRQVGLAAAFGVCDAVGSLIRSFTGLWETSPPPWSVSHEFLLSAATYLAAVLLVRVVAAGKRLSFVWMVPVILGLDNLMGPRILSFSIGSIALVGLASASMSLLGFRLGTFLVSDTRKWMAHGLSLRRMTP